MWAPRSSRSLAMRIEPRSGSPAGFVQRVQRVFSARIAQLGVRLGHRVEVDPGQPAMDTRWTQTAWQEETSGGTSQHESAALTCPDGTRRYRETPADTLLVRLENRRHRLHGLRTTYHDLGKRYR